MRSLSFFSIAALLGLIAFTVTSVYLNQKEIWFSNLDQDSVLLINALRINDGRAPTYFDHPAQGVYILYGGMFRLFNKIGLSPIGKFSDLEKHQDPIRLVPTIFYSGRRMSILISILCVLIASASIYVYTRSWEYAGLGSAFLSASPGLLLQSLLVRSELTSVLFLCLAVFLLTLALRYPHRLSLFFSIGIMFALAYVTKIQVLPFGAFILLLIAVAISGKVRSEDGSLKSIRFLFSVIGLALLCVLGFAVMRSFHALYLAHVVYHFLQTMGAFPDTLVSIGILLSPFVAVGTYLFLRDKRRFSRSADVTLGFGFISSSIFLISFPTLLPLLARLRGVESFDQMFYLPLWQAVLVSLASLGLGVCLLWKGGSGDWFLNQVRVSWILMSGFFIGLLLSLVLCSALGDSRAAGLTDSRLFNFHSMNEFSTTGSAVLSVRSFTPLIREFKTFVLLYLSKNYLLSGYGTLLILALTLRGAASRYLWPSLTILATGLLFMIFCSSRYYAQQYWVYIDFFFMGAWAFLVFGLMERFETIRIRIGVAALIGVLYVSQYGFVAKAYLHYNLEFRDRIDEAAHAIYRVPDYSELMNKRYGDNLTFIRRVLSDPLLNGSDRGIDLLSKSGVKRVIESTPELNGGSGTLPRKN